MWTWEHFGHLWVLSSQVFYVCGLFLVFFVCGCFVCLFYNLIFRLSQRSFFAVCLLEAFSMSHSSLEINLLVSSSLFSIKKCSLAHSFCTIKNEESWCRCSCSALLKEKVCGLYSSQGGRAGKLGSVCLLGAQWMCTVPPGRDSVPLCSFGGVCIGPISVAFWLLCK